MSVIENFYTTDTISKVLPERLKYFRNKARLTTYDIGEKLNKTPSTVTLWENGKAQPSVETLLKLCNIYKILLHQLDKEWRCFWDTKHIYSIKKHPLDLVLQRSL